MERIMKTFIFIQARYNSSRLHGKVLKKIYGKSIIQIIYENLQKIKSVDGICVLIPDNKENIKLKKHLEIKNIPFFLGNEKNVLSRFYNTAKRFKANTIVRITADCPFTDYKIIDQMLEIFANSNVDILSNVIKPTFPDGLDIEVFNFKSLKIANNFAKNLYDREHVTSYMYKKKFFIKKNFEYKSNYSNLRFTIDEKKDLALMNQIINKIKNLLPNTTLIIITHKSEIAKKTDFIFNLGK